MDDFKSFLQGKKSEKRTKKRTNVSMSEDLKIDINPTSTTEEIASSQQSTHTSIKTPTRVLEEAQKILSEDTTIPTFSEIPTTGYVGAFNYVPEPSMFAEGAEYRNKNNGTVYKKVGNLWEEYVRDGRDGRSFSPVGGGCGVQEVNNIFNSRIIVSSAAPVGDVIPGTIWIVV